MLHIRYQLLDIKYVEIILFSRVFDLNKERYRRTF